MQLGPRRSQHPTHTHKLEAVSLVPKEHYLTTSQTGFTSHNRQLVHPQKAFQIWEELQRLFSTTNYCTEQETELQIYKVLSPRS